MYRINFTDTVKKSVTLTIFAFFLLLCIFSLMIGSTFHIADPPGTYLGISSAAGSSAERMDFLRALGYCPNEESEESEDVTIPAVFGDVYTRYNELQSLSGGDLTLYKGAHCTRYTYTDSETGKRLNLLVYNDRVIGGDVCTAALDGEMEPLGAKNNK